MTKRNSNLELLRILSILMIISHHYYYHGGFTELSTGNRIFLQIVGGGARTAIACFVLITGYYGERIKPGRVVALVKDRWVYSFLITVILLAIGAVTYSQKLLFQTLFPILSCRHNYITAFCLLCLFIPFLNKFVDSPQMSKRSLETFILLSAITLSAIPTVIPQFANNTYCYLFWMMFLFIIGRCLSLYEYNFHWKLLLLLSFVLHLTALFYIEPHTSYSVFRMANTQYTITNLIIPVCLLEIFSKMPEKNNSVINWLAKSVFAVYIIHDDPYIREIIWSRIFQNSRFGMSKFLPLHFLFTVAAIFVVCVITDKLLRATLFKAVDKLPFDKLQNKINLFYETL